MDSLGTLCLFGVIAIVLLFVLPGLMRGFGAPDYTRRGRENSEYDDPNIRSRGGFGGWGGFGRRRREYDDQDIDSRGNFGSGGGSRRSSGSGSGFFGGGRSSGGSRRVDSPNIRSRGSFGGRSK